MSELIVYKKDQKIFHVPLDSPQLTIGRSSDCDLVLNGDTVSRKHVVIEKRDHHFWVVDQSSTGTLLNDQRMTTAVELKEGSRIGISEWVLVFQENSLAFNKEDQTRQTQISKLVSGRSSDATRILQIQPTGKITPLRPTLIIDDADGGQRHYLVKSKRVVMGTGLECDVILKDHFVSKLHAEFTLSDQGFHVRDMDSTNGTFLRGTKIREAYIKNDEAIQVGKSRVLVSFVAEADEDIPPFAEQQFCGICGAAQDMRLLYSRIERVAVTDMTVLIQGETGAGKEMVARAVHDLSSRKSKPYVVLNCGAVQPNLVESELFGHEKGSFTGADQRHIGAFEEASGGTLFLDEIGELPLEMQAKILRVLEYQTLRRVGGNQDVRVDVRVIAATHRNLMSEVARKKFREDLFYRIHVLTLVVPPLRDRKEDIELLARYFISRFAQSSEVALLPEALERLKAHAWPGNVRELKNTILRALAFCDGHIIMAKDIDILHVPLAKSSFADSLDKTALNPNDVLDTAAQNQLERDRIIKAITSAKGDKNEAARMLGIGRSTLFRKVKELGIE